MLCLSQLLVFTLYIFLSRYFMVFSKLLLLLPETLVVAEEVLEPLAAAVQADPGTQEQPGDRDQRHEATHGEAG